jgi:crotonobetainyl-CoA:carnitine CoA-transferase CaiB-like acyl-CoA transferase
MNQQPLSGIRVVDLTHVLAGPYCTYLLGLLGAEIIKVEIPGGEMGRRMAPPGPLRDAGLGAAFLAQAAGKRMLAVDIRKPEGAEILRQLLRNADVFVEGLRPGAVARAGFDEASLRALNPRLVFASVSGFGQDGPLSPWPAYDHVVQAMSGLMSVTGTPESAPLRVGPPIVDYVAGLYAAFAVMAGLAVRDRTTGALACRRRPCPLANQAKIAQSSLSPCAGLRLCRLLSRPDRPLAWPRKEWLFRVALRPSAEIGGLSQKGEGVDAPRRHLRAKVTASNRH